MLSKSELIIQQYLFLSKNEDRRLYITFSKPFQCNPSFFIFPRLGASKLAQNSFSSFSIIFFFSESFYMFYMKPHCMKFGYLIFFLYSLFLWRMAFLSPSNNQGLRVLYLICTFCFGIYISYNLVKFSWKAEKADCISELEYISDQSKLEIAFKNNVRLRAVLTCFSTVISFSRLE